MKGDENAQVLFKYANKQDDNIKKVFAISKEAPEYEELKKIGEVVNWRSIKHLIYFLLCDNLISSQADSYIVNPYGRWGKYFNDLYTFNFIFLQHGVIKDDLSSWLNKMDKDIDLFITSAKPEYNSIVENDYLYTKDEVLLSGLPRFDRLKNNPQKKILIMPTWRDYLTNKSNNLGIRGKNDNFKDTEYFKFYNNLINDKRLLETLKKLDYKMIFCLHPNAIKNADDFGSNEFVSIPTEICDYPKEFGEGSLLITDYSSVAFDFTYLRKPVLYCQFDKEKFLSKHSYEAGYFDYNRDGFGPVCKDLDSTITEIINVLDNDCKLDKKYRKRIDNFFKYNDKKNSQRVYEKIIQLES
jgi:CDP-glycerol glycerophosphotransferase (TagB/SpsB family)